MNRIKQIRRQKKLTQKELAKQLGLTQSSVSQWEHGRTRPDTGVLIRLAEILGCTVDELLGIEKTPAEQRT